LPFLSLVFRAQSRLARSQPESAAGKRFLSGTGATLIICLGYLLRALRWRTLLAPITETSLKELFATTTVGYAAVFVVVGSARSSAPMWLPMRDPRVRPSAALMTLGVSEFLIWLRWSAFSPSISSGLRLRQDAKRIWVC
jgi:hypothetical protein